MYEKITLTLQEEIAAFLDLSPSEIDPHTPLADFGIDSLQTLQLLVLLERNFGIRMDESDLQYFTTVNSIAALSIERLSKVEAPWMPALIAVAN